MDFWAMLAEIPEVIWGIAAGSFFSVIAVMLTNKANLKRQRIQLEHEREEKRKDRDMALRRDLYLEAAEAISVGVDAVGLLGDFGKPVEELVGPAIRRTSAITKVYLVASEETIAAVARFVQDLSSAYARLVPMRLRIESLNGEIRRIDRRIQRASEERDHLLAALKQSNAAGAAGQNRWGQLREKLEFENARIDELLTRRKQLEEQLLPAKKDLFKSSQAAVRELNTFLVPVIKSVRRKLELPVDERVLWGAFEEEYQAQTAQAGDPIPEAVAAQHPGKGVLGGSPGSPAGPGMV